MKRVLSSTDVNENLGEILLKINKESVENDYELIVNKTTSPTEDYPWLAAYENLSELYSININLSENQNKQIILKKPTIIEFIKNNNNPENRYYAAKRTDGKWYFHAPSQYSSTSLTYYTHSLSDWILVKEKNFSNLEKTPYITASSTIYTSGKGKKFKNNLENILGSFTWNGTHMNFKPSDNLNEGAKYNINIAATYFDDNSSTPISPTSWTFTTAPAEGGNWVKLYNQNEQETIFVPRSEHVMLTFNNNLWIIGGKKKRKFESFATYWKFYNSV